MQKELKQKEFTLSWVIKLQNTALMDTVTCQEMRFLVVVDISKKLYYSLNCIVPQRFVMSLLLYFYTLIVFNGMLICGQ